MKYKLINKHILNTTAMMMSLFSSCYKVDVTFEDNDRYNDPDISFLDTYKPDISTYKIDSFITSNTGIFMLGTHRDTFFTQLTGETYAEIAIPAENKVSDKDVIFDSLVLLLTPTGNYYGDTLMPLPVSVYELDERLENNNRSNDDYYYPRTFSVKPQPLATATLSNIKPSRKKEMTIRLPDSLGQRLLTMLRRNRDTIATQSEFRNFLKGICIKSDSVFSRTIYYFTAGTGNSLLRLHYRERGIYTTEQTIDFGFIKTKQFNHISYNNNGASFSLFRQFKKELVHSSKTKGKAFISNNMPSYMKITFPDLLQLKELAPYVRVIKAELEIKPAPYSYKYPYQLPSQLRLLNSNADHEFSSYVLDINGAEQTGNLFIDKLYGRDTKYSFDITQFINTIIAEGRYSTKSLFLTTAATGFSTESSRLVINESTATDGIKLKLYVLGL